MLATRPALTPGLGPAAGTDGPGGRDRARTRRRDGAARARASGPQSGQRSKIFACDPGGELQQECLIEGQDLASVALPAHGLQALALDGSGLLYAIDDLAGPHPVAATPRSSRPRR